jgi:hypothetical protein
LADENIYPVYTEEEIEAARRLESIFMPAAMLRREALTRDDFRFVHYTSAEAGLAIIGSKRIWMRNTTCMADYREVQHGFDLMNKYFADKEKITVFSDALDQNFPEVTNEAINYFNQWWNDTRFNTYISFISEHDRTEDSHGRLSMWRAFGGNTARVAIVFKLPRISNGSRALNLMFSPVAYMNEPEVEEEIKNVISNIKRESAYLGSLDRWTIIHYVFLMLIAAVTCLKHEGFREEREWRVLYSPGRTPSSLMEKATVAIGGVPQVIYKIPLDAGVSSILADLDLTTLLDRIIIGPTPYPLVMYGAIVERLKEIGVQDADKRVFISGIPIRA